MNVYSRKGEAALIRRIRSELQTPAPAREPRPRNFIDDMALLTDDSQALLWTVDMLMDGVDFRSTEHDWYDIGRKAMAVNLSDCAAMAAQPLAALCAVSLSNHLAQDDAVNLVRGAHGFGLRWNCPIVGGDTNSWDQPTVIAITIAARTESGRKPVCRDGARPGDLIYLSGPVGGSILGRHMAFEPRIETALAINRQLAPHAMIDISDGLALDLSRVLEASQCAAVLDARALDALTHTDAQRLSVRDGRPAREHALHDGEDFELIVMLPPNADPAACQALGLHALGRIESGSGVVLSDPDGRQTPIEPRGWEHFQ
jgi:thiamine-monophosphate kinase